MRAGCGKGIMDNSIIVPIEKLKNWKDNPREVSTSDFQRLKRQIQRLGFYTPLIAYVGTSEHVCRMNQDGTQTPWAEIEGVAVEGKIEDGN